MRGNSHFKDTDLRAKAWRSEGIQFLGVGVSGGEDGARHGPSIMPGGPKEAYERVRADLRSSRGQGGWRTCVDLAWARLGGTLREDGPQRHRVRRDAAYRRDLRPDEARAWPERRRTARRLQHMESRVNSTVTWWRSPATFSLKWTSRPASGSSTKSSTWPSRKALACGPRKARWNCKCRLRPSTWRWRCEICPCFEKEREEASRDSPRDLSAGLKATVRSLSANCGARFTRG